ncbi:cupin domain-containing protein [Shimia sp. Alg240-R146]|uniref:cupin domain-containing protein n=1 Tax=Shimia sp. Alg240-R146 TaxID=2993449 RepID=UPI0022E97ADD|nr:cupin domain-containing protein [Shimia sp. Alg240-R146]
MTGAKRYSYVPPGGGPNYDWSADHTFVKVAAADTGGQYTLMEDNLKANFRLGLHLHRHHAETFYILEGLVDFYVDGDWMTAKAGTCLHVPPGIEHACVMANGCEAARMLMVYQPAGFDQYLAELATMSEADFADDAKMSALNEKYDIVNLGPVPERPTA